MNGLGAAITLILVGFVWAAPRNWRFGGLVAAVCYITQGQQVAVAGFHFTTVRAVLLAGVLKAWTARDFQRLQINIIDKALVGYTLLSSLIYIARLQDIQAVIYTIGCCYDALLSYAFCRAVFTDLEDVVDGLCKVAIVALPFAGLMCLESISGRNPFAMFGGVPEMAWVRGGHVRSMGSFRCPITAGSFGATLAPMFAAMYIARWNRPRAILGFIVATIITMAARSSGPMLAFAGGMGALMLWRCRLQLSLIRRGIVVLLVAAHFLMSSPVWFLIAKPCDWLGGDGYYRAHLIDIWLRSWPSWWLWGTSDTADWMPTQLGSGSTDITNQFILTAINGGLISLAMYVFFLYKCFQGLGRRVRETVEDDFGHAFVVWGLGATLFAHLLNITAVTYFDQMHVMWYFLVAAIAAAAYGFEPQEVEEWREEENPEETQPATGGAGTFPAFDSRGS